MVKGLGGKGEEKKRGGGGEEGAVGWGSHSLKT